MKFARRWTQDESAFLVGSRGRGIAWCAERLGRTPAECALRLECLTGRRESRRACGKPKAASACRQEAPKPAASPVQALVQEDRRGAGRPSAVIPDGWLSAKEVAFRCGTSVSRVHYACWSGFVEAKQLKGGVWAIRAESVGAYAERVRSFRMRREAKLAGGVR